MKLLRRCLRCGGRRYKAGAYCSRCLSRLRRRHRRWAAHRGPPQLDADEPPRSKATPRPVCLDISNICMTPPSLDSRLGFGFWCINGSER